MSDENAKSPSLQIMEDPAQIAQLQDEVMALVSAWADRGLAPQHAAIVLAGFAHHAMKLFGLNEAELHQMIRSKWSST